MPRQTRPKPRKAAPTEKQVTAQVLDAARLYGLVLERRNVGLALGASGRPVAFGKPGDPDWEGTVPAGPSRGRRLAVEIKAGDFDPRKLRGEKAEHFARQLAAMTAINEAGGFAFWTRDGKDAARVFERLMSDDGLRIEFTPDGFGVMVDDEPEGAGVVA